MQCRVADAVALTPLFTAHTRERDAAPTASSLRHIRRVPGRMYKDRIAESTLGPVRNHKFLGNLIP